MNASKIRDERFWRRWNLSGALGWPAYVAACLICDVLGPRFPSGFAWLCRRQSSRDLLISIARSATARLAASPDKDGVG